MYSENKDGWNEELIVRFIGKTIINEIALAAVVDIAKEKEVRIAIPKNLIIGIKKGDLILLKGKKVKLEDEYGFAASACKKIYSDKVMNVIGE
jgi:exoribonuclease II